MDHVNFTGNGSDGQGQHMSTYDHVMGIWLPGTVCSLGILGNLLALVVLSKDRSGCPTFVSLRALATSDLLLLLGALLQQIIPLSCVASADTSAFCRYQGYARVYCWPLVCIAQMNTIWTTVTISSERYVAICFPLRASRICSAGRIKKVIVGVCALSVIFNLPKFFEFRAERLYESDNVTFSVIVVNTALREHPIYRYLYNTGFFFLVIYALPMITLTLLNVRIVKEVRTARRNWELLHRTRKNELQATVLPLVIVLVYFLCCTPSLIAFILDAVYVHSSARWLQVYMSIVNLLVIVNSAVNFILMYAFGRKFRDLLLDRVLCCRESPATKRYSFNRRISQKCTLGDEHGVML